MSKFQAGILGSVPRLARYLTFSLTDVVGAEDGIVDALFRFTRPVSGSYFWCPPMKNGRLDLRAAGIR
jgi:deferrochelatase/peroxidase EfeB